MVGPTAAKVYTESRLRRHGWKAQGTALGATVLTMSLGLTACGSSSTKASSSATTANASSSSATTTKTSSATGTSIVVATNFLPSSVDPDPKNPADAEFASVTSTNLAGTLFSYLGDSADPATTASILPPTPELATSATTSSDGLSVTVQLRANVMSQYDNPLTASDVVWTMQRIVNTNLYGDDILKDANISQTDPATATGPLTVVFHLTKPTSLFDRALALPFTDILDKKAVLANAGAGHPWGRTWLTTHSASFGPYEVATTQFPSKIVYKANPYYWRGKPSITKATFIVESNDSTRLATVLSGQADYAVGLNTSDLAKVKSTPSVVAYLQPNAILLYYLVFNLKNSQVQSVDLRRAVSMAIDRQTLVSTAFTGAANAVTGCLPSNLYPGEPQSSLDNPAAGNPSAAHALLSSVPGPHNVTIGYLSSTSDQAMGEIIQQDLAKAGITATLKPYSSYSVFAGDQAKSKFGIGIDGFGPFIPTAAYVFNNLLVSTSGSNQGFYSNPAVDAAAATAMSTSGATRSAALATACNAMLKDVPIAMLGSVATVSAYSTKITKVSSTGQIPLLYNMRMK